MNDSLRDKYKKREEIKRIQKIVHEYNYEYSLMKKKVEGYYTIDLNSIELDKINSINDLIKVSDKYVLRNENAPIGLDNHVKWRYSKEYRKEFSDGVNEENIKVKNKYEGFSRANNNVKFFGLYESLDKEKLYIIVNKYK